MIHDLVRFVRELEAALGKTSDVMQLLQPKFSLVGSIPEGTRIGLGNELDVTIDFDGWRDSPPFVAGVDANHLIRSASCPEWMSCFFDAKGCFDFHSFMFTLLEGIDTAVQDLFHGESTIVNEGKLSMITPNEEYVSRKCKKCVWKAVSKVKN